MRACLSLATIGLLIVGCGKRDADTADADTADEPAPAPVTTPVPVSGTATGEGKSLKLGWGIAMWDDKKDGELVLGFLESAPSSDDLKEITSNKSLFMGVFLDDPFVQINIEFKKDSEGKPDIGKPDYHAVLYAKFGEKGPMTLNRYASSGGVISLAGELAPGGQVEGRLQGTDTFEVPDDVRKYEWDITVDLPVE